MITYIANLRSDEAKTARRLEYRSEDVVELFTIISLDGTPALVDAVTVSPHGVPQLECRRLWRLRLRLEDGEPATPEWIVNEQRHFGEVDTIIIEDGARFRLVRVEPMSPPGFDVSLVVRPLADEAHDLHMIPGEEMGCRAHST